MYYTLKSIESLVIWKIKKHRYYVNALNFLALQTYSKLWIRIYKYSVESEQHFNYILNNFRKLKEVKSENSPYGKKSIDAPTAQQIRDTNWNYITHWSSEFLSHEDHLNTKKFVAQH